MPSHSVSLAQKCCRCFWHCRDSRRLCVCGEDASHQYFTIWVYYWTLNAAAESILYVFVYLCVRVCELKMLWLKRRRSTHSLCSHSSIYEMTCLWVKCYCTTINKNWTLNGQNCDRDRLRVTVGRRIRTEKTPSRTEQNKHKPNNHCMRQRIGCGSTFFYIFYTFCEWIKCLLSQSNTHHIMGTFSFLSLLRGGSSTLLLSSSPRPLFCVPFIIFLPFCNVVFLAFSFYFMQLYLVCWNTKP